MDEKKPSTSTTSTPPTSSQPTVSPQPATSPPVKGPIISRRRFLQGALAASAVLAAASVGASGQILGPQIPTPLPPQVIADWNVLDGKYQNVKADLTTKGLYNEMNYSQFFYWQYDSSVSPYYKNIIARLPDFDSSGNPLVNPLYPTDPILKHVVAFNTTCVHLRCLVNPGYAGDPGSGEFRLQCPCHGSQYRLVDAIPVAGPAFDLGLNPLPQVELSVDSSGKISATGMKGTPGIGRT
jgi:Rieske Fe-S protein